MEEELSISLLIPQFYFLEIMSVNSFLWILWAHMYAYLILHKGFILYMWCSIPSFLFFSFNFWSILEIFLYWYIQVCVYVTKYIFFQYFGWNEFQLFSSCCYNQSCRNFYICVLANLCYYVHWILSQKWHYWVRGQVHFL